MRYGHHPRDIDDYTWKDIQEFVAALPAAWENENLAGLGGK
ncbi:hypothetical protein [Natrinema hispanicum]|uniref:Uncharacterized protein n=1 Tax=Natrinema hispanicum TaxID=392421 RepID=A0A1I0IUU2_9EURY|nr:hypothetical protein [Natrinema hispanicum]SEU00983.1 hypothetical protein SAMN04488694_12624 [Natrinema hispanicum]